MKTVWSEVEDIFAAEAVVDLQIEKGKVIAKVQGRKKTPYKTEIRISPVNEEKIQRIMNECGCQE